MLYSIVRHEVFGKKLSGSLLIKTGLNNVLVPILFIVLNDSVEPKSG